MGVVVGLWVVVGGWWRVVGDGWSVVGDDSVQHAGAQRVGGFENEPLIIFLYSEMLETWWKLKTF